MKKVRLYGELGKKYGKEHMLNVASPAEAVRALDANFEGFCAHLIDMDRRGLGIKVTADKKAITDISDIHNPCSGSIRFTPMVAGSKSGGAQILTAIAIAVISYYTFGAGGASLIASNSTVANMGYMMAFSMAMGGISQLLTKVPQQKSVDANASKVISGTNNVSAQGNPVPVGYGRRIVGSAVISSGISVTQDGKSTSGIGGDTVGNGTYPKPAQNPPTLVWNTLAARWEEMSGAGLKTTGSRNYDSGAWTTSDGRAPFFNVAEDRWDLPDPYEVGVWNSTDGTWVMWSTSIGNGPIVRFNATNKMFESGNIGLFGDPNAATTIESAGG